MASSVSSTRAASTTASITDPTIDKKWYSEDEHSEGLMIAYQAGKEAPIKEFKAILVRNVTKAKDAGEALFQLLWINKIKSSSLHLRRTNYNCFELLAVIPEKDYLSAAFDTAYKLSKTLETDTQEFKLTIHLMPKNKDLDFKTIYSDGFKLTFGTAPK